MRTIDFAPLYRSTVGFDRLFQLLDDMTGLNGDTGGFPPYNIERLAENDYRITMAVAGFAESDLKLEQHESTLTVRGDKAADTKKERSFLHRGLAERTFERRFQLADHVEVKGANVQDGLLHIDLVRNVPERLKPRSIAIGSVAAGSKQIEAKAA